jgi:molybdopterin/thiamine biosynthesis adenylyltransferase
MSEPREHPAALKSESVAVIGLGNNGGQVVTHLARTARVKRLVLVDHDSVRPENRSQEYLPSDIGQKKAIATARRVRRIRQHDPVEVEAIVARVEDVPWGRIRVGVIIGCVDSALPRLSINEIAWRLGVPWIDTGIRADGSLARVQLHIPAIDAPCFECSLGVKDRDSSLSRAFSCDGRLNESAPTGASSALGGLAASLAAIECQKLFDGSMDQSLAGRQLIVEARYHHYYVNTLRRNRACPFDHQVWSIQKAPQTVRTVGDLVEHGRKLLGGELPVSVSAERMWVTRLVCLQCGQQARALRLQGRIGAKQRRCAQCGGEMQSMGFYLLPHLDIGSAGDRLLARPLRRFGLCSCDILTLNGSHGCQHVELSLADEPGGN